VDDLSRMYRLFSKITKGLDPVANMFKQVFYFLIGDCLDFTFWCSAHGLIIQHVTAEGMTLVQQAEDAASNKVIVITNSQSNLLTFFSY